MRTGGMSHFSPLPPSQVEASGEHEWMSDVGERETTAECRIVGRRDGRVGRLPLNCGHSHLMAAQPDVCSLVPAAPCFTRVDPVVARIRVSWPPF